MYSASYRAWLLEGGGENPPPGLQVHYVLADETETPIRFEILDDSGKVVHTDSSDMEGTVCGRGQAATPRPQTISTNAGDNLWQWRMQMGRFECFPEIYSVSGSMDAYTAAPGQYTVRMTIGDFVREQPFRIHVVPRLGGDTPENLEEYAAMDALSTDLMAAANEMSKGVSELRLVKKQLDLITELDQNANVTARAAELDAAIDGWIAYILQKELKTFQHVYQHEGRLLMKFKDLLGRMHGSDIPLTDGFGDVTRDYLGVWSRYRSELEELRSEQIPAFNRMARDAGVAELHIP